MKKRIAHSDTGPKEFDMPAKLKNSSKRIAMLFPGIVIAIAVIGLLLFPRPKLPEAVMEDYCANMASASTHPPLKRFITIQREFLSIPRNSCKKIRHISCLPSIGRESMTRSHMRRGSETSRGWHQLQVPKEGNKRLATHQALGYRQRTRGADIRSAGRQ